MSGLLVHIHQKKKIALEITATVASVNGPSQRRDSIYFVSIAVHNIDPMWLSLKQGMGNRGIRESGNPGIGESGNRGIRESGNRGIHPAVHTRLPMPIFKTGNPPCGAY